MAKSRLKENVFRLIPTFLMKRIDHASFSIQQFVFSASIETSPGSWVLDAGAGETPFKKFFNPHKYLAIDTKWGDAAWDYSKLDILGDLASLPIREGVFDTVICIQVLEHVREPGEVLCELYRVLKRGGKLYLSAPQGWGVHQAPHDYFRYTRYGLEYLLEKAGFRICSITPTCGYFGYLANRLTVFPKILFWQIRSKVLRIILLPIEITSYLLFVMILPLLLNSMDSLDREKNFTLNYLVKALKDE